MSIATFKKKTNTQYNNMSTNRSNFSLVGGRRSQGYVGQDGRSRTIIKTPMVGNVPKGYGGQGGKYEIHIVNPTGIDIVNDASVMKKSCINTDGLIETKYAWSKRGYPYSSVKPDSNLNNNTGGQYIQNLQQSTLQCLTTNTNKPVSKSNGILINELSSIMRPSYTNILLQNGRCNAVMKPVNGNLSQGEYMQQMDTKCSQYIDFYVSKNVNGSPILGGGTVTIG